MGTVIYSAGPFQAFLIPIATILFLLVLGIVGIVMAIFRRKQGTASRVVLGVVGIFLILATCIYGGLTAVSLTGGSHTVTVHLDQKTVAQQTCGDNGDSTCTSYVLETSGGGTEYDFTVSQSTFDLAQVNGCYQFTYYPQKGLFNNNVASSSFQQIDLISRIVVADPSACQ